MAPKVKTTLSGIGVGETSAWGKAFVFSPRPKAPAESKSTLGVEVERARLIASISKVSTSLGVTAGQADETTSEIINALLSLVQDPALVEEAEAHLVDGWNAETSVLRAMKSFTELLQGDDLFAERIADLQDLALRIVASLSGQEIAIAIPKIGPIVVVAEDLSPADTALFTNAVVGVVTSGGGPTSHTAIICRQRNIPAVVAVTNAITSIVPGEGLLVDAFRGEVSFSETQLDTSHSSSRNRTGLPISEVKGNVGSVDDARILASTEASGIGLMRTELLFLSRSTAPSLDEQTDLYAQILEIAPKGEVIFRTLDAGSDKPLPYLGIVKEENPSLGVRGFRINSVDSEILETQLSALFAAEKRTGRKISVMAPMIATVEEAIEFTTLARKHGLSSVGIMVETPSICALLSQLEGIVDFISVGTNDLSQYLFAADRQNSRVAHLLNPWQPGLLKVLSNLCIDASLAGIKVGVCGEAAADPLLAVVLAGLGVKSLSMAAPAVSRANDYLSSINMERAIEVASAALRGKTPQEARELALASLG